MFSVEKADMVDHREFLAEGRKKVEIINKAIDALIDIADAGMGNPITADAITNLNAMRWRVEREYQANA